VCALLRTTREPETNTRSALPAAGEGPAEPNDVTFPSQVELRQRLNSYLSPPSRFMTTDHEREKAPSKSPFTFYRTVTILPPEKQCRASASLSCPSSDYTRTVLDSSTPGPNCRPIPTPPECSPSSDFQRRLLLLPCTRQNLMDSDACDAITYATSLNSRQVK
jgi:hypothetical protein